tara:strand:- start:222041 stop:224218 length:2178 start_codon:yes stop_codon:yes gene_type:complete
MKKQLSILLLCIIGFTAYAQEANTINVQVYTQKDSIPLVGATVYLPQLNKGTVTNVDGKAILENIKEGSYQLSVSYIGFQPYNQTVTLPADTELTVYLEENDNALEEVVLQSSRSTRTIQRIPTRIEFIGGEELAEKSMMNATNISMVLRESTGIQMQQTSLSSGNMNIRIQGLDGRYTQLLKDGFPLYGGFSSGLSIMQIPPLDLKQFEIIKGSSSTLYGGGAIAGLVNLVSKTPKEEPELDLMFTQTHALGSTANVFFSQRKGKWGTTLYASGHYQKVYDPEDDGFSNLPKTKSVSINPKLFYYPDSGTQVWLGINATYDDRIGGDMAIIQGEAGDGHKYTEANISKRISSQAVFEKKFDSGDNLTFKNSVSYFNRDLKVPNLRFQGSQINTFTEASYKMSTANADWIFGSNLYTIDFDENSPGLQRDQQDITAGVFANNVYDISEKWIVETGFRGDYSRDWGFFALPRISLLYKGAGGFSSRIGGGLGYKIPDIFTEEAEFINFEGVQPIDKDKLEAERSYGANLDFNYSTFLTDEIRVSANQLFYYTAIKNGLLLAQNSTDSYVFENATGNISSKGAETNIKFAYKDFRWFLNYAFIDTHLDYLPGNPEKPLTPKHNAGSVVMYESETWRLGFETYYTGSQMLSNGTETTDYITMGFLAVRNFNWGSIYTNFENFTDRRQSRFSPLVAPPHDNPTFPEIYAPTDGIIVSAGIIYKLFGNEE